MCHSRFHTKKLSTRVNNYVLCSWYLARTKMITWLSTQRSWGQRSNANSLKTPSVCVWASLALQKRTLKSTNLCWNLKSKNSTSTASPYAIILCWSCDWKSYCTSLVPRPSPHVREGGSGVLSDFSCQMGWGSSPIWKIESDCRTHNYWM